MHFLVFLIEIFYVPLLAFLAESNLTHFRSAEQSECVFNRSLNAIIFVINADISINGYEFGHVACRKNLKAKYFLPAIMYFTQVLFCPKTSPSQ